MKESLEDVITRIDRIAARMEENTTTLDEAIKDFEEGMNLSRLAKSMLEEAEQKVRILGESGDLGKEDAAAGDSAEAASEITEK